jgi:hypothetical protein
VCVCVCVCVCVGAGGHRRGLRLGRAQVHREAEGRTAGEPFISACWLLLVATTRTHVGLGGHATGRQLTWPLVLWLLHVTQQAFCHLNRRNCWAEDKGLGALQRTLQVRLSHVGGDRPAL